jgi:hypothetical protein
MRGYAVSIEAEHWAAGEWNPLDDNTDVWVRFADGTEWVATFFTYQNVLTLKAKNQQTGECLDGRYFWAIDMVLVDEVSRERIEQVVAHLVESGKLKDIFRRCLPQDDEPRRP